MVEVVVVVEVVGDVDVVAWTLKVTNHECNNSRNNNY